MKKEVTLQFKYGHSSWTVYSHSEWKYETFVRVYKLGDTIGMKYFMDHVITEITDDHIIFEYKDDKQILTREEPIHIETEIEGREWSDGCVYEGDDYSTDVSWIDPQE